ncbi:hypothetical protein ACFVVM_33085, partial [Nocardia sp. NPDC058176]|uniref:hypothetical protein n=1 Tax=Nocardia sp. NPDC058176 TaxID=3346368 RepID=UPI0036DA13AC
GRVVGMYERSAEAEARVTGLQYAVEATSQIEARLREIPDRIADADKASAAVRRDVGELLEVARQIGADSLRFDRRTSPPSGRDVSTPSVRLAAELTGLTRPTLLSWRDSFVAEADGDDVAGWSTRRLAAAHLHDLEARLLYVPACLTSGNAVSRELLARYPRLAGFLAAATTLGDFHMEWIDQQNPTVSIIETVRLSEPALEAASADLRQRYIDWVTDLAAPLWPPTDPAVHALLTEN